MRNNFQRKFVLNKKLENFSSLKTFRFNKVPMISLNKAILIPALNSKSVLSTAYKSNISNNNTKPKIKINKFKISNNFKNINQILSYTDRNRININLTNNKRKNNIFDKNFKKFTSLSRNIEPNGMNTISYAIEMSFLRNKSVKSENSSIISPFQSSDRTLIQKNNSNSSEKYVDDYSGIKIQNQNGKNKQLKSILVINNNIKSKIAKKITPKNKIILKSNILKKTYFTKNRKINIEQKNKKFLQFLFNNNNKEKLEDIIKTKNEIIKNNSIIAKKIYSEKHKNYKNKISNNKIIYLDYFKICKKEIFSENYYSTEKYLFNIIINSIKIKEDINIHWHIIQYCTYKYNYHKYLLSLLGIKPSTTKKKKQKNYLFIDEHLKRRNSFKVILENEINTQNNFNKDKENKENILPKFSYVKAKVRKRNSLINSNKFWEKYSPLKNIEFFKNTIKKENEIINIDKKRTSNYKRSMYTQLNRRISRPPKIILKKEDFQNFKVLIEERKENQFEFEFHKIINIYDVNSCDKFGNTLLTYACMNGDIIIVKYLLSIGANPNCINKYKNTPLHYALSYKYYDIADLLIQNKAKDNIKNIYGLTPW